MTRLAALDIHMRRGGRPVLTGAGLSVTGGECVGLIGPNGAGKSTLLSIMAGLATPDGGSVLMDDQPLGSWTRAQRARRLGFLEQGADCHWPLSVERVVTLGRLPHANGWAGPWSGETAADRAAIARAMERCDVTALSGRNVLKLSGGERARVMLARVLAGEPDILLADEPAAGLDPYHQLQVMELLAALARGGMAVIVVLHDLSLALRHCTRLCLLSADGRVAADGPPVPLLNGGIIEQVYGVELLRGGHQGMPYALPWRRLDMPAGGPAP
ncbi:ABC transporter ATP-binding protein [Niveispirillum fermenti]|uniref:ABC transporter ATP-binding protein n=1 Tax=Niveispirillum fermenti TaxID=1233113 RepID=UPI003A8A49C0